MIEDDDLIDASNLNKQFKFSNQKLNINPQKTNTYINSSSNDTKQTLKPQQTEQVFSLQLENHCLKQQLLELQSLLLKQKSLNNGDEFMVNNENIDLKTKDIEIDIQKPTNNDIKMETDIIDEESDDISMNIIEENKIDLVEEKEPPCENLNKNGKRLRQEKVEYSDALKDSVKEDLQYLNNFLFKRFKNYPIGAIRTSPSYSEFAKNIFDIFSLKRVNQSTQSNDVKLIGKTGIRERREDKKKRINIYAQSIDIALKNDGSEQLKLEYINESSNITTTKEEEIENLPTNQDESEKLKYKLKIPRLCYVCKCEYYYLHFFYDQLCWKCSQTNYSKRFNTADMNGTISIVTGSRIKIGYQCVLKLLRAGGTVIATTRFPKDSAIRYSQEKDYNSWKDRLHIYSLNLCDLKSLELFCKHIQSKYSHIDIIINNAAQTIKRSAKYYDTVNLIEAKDISQLPESTRIVLSQFENHKKEYLTNQSNLMNITTSTEFSNPLFEEQQKVFTHNLLTFKPKIETTDDNGNKTLVKSTLPNDYNPDDHIDLNDLDEDGLPNDKRPVHSWIQKVYQTSTLELLESHAVSSFSPFIMLSHLFDLLKAAANRTGSIGAFVLNVSAMEGKFSRFYKSSNHPHTNMAKASQNMFTRTSAAELSLHKIYMNSIEVGWITDERTHLQKQRVKDRSGTDWQPPIDDIDGAARTLDPVFEAIHSSNPTFGLFYKNYFPVNW